MKESVVDINLGRGRSLKRYLPIYYNNGDDPQQEFLVQFVNLLSIYLKLLLACLKNKQIINIKRTPQEAAPDRFPFLPLFLSALFSSRFFCVLLVFLGFFAFAQHIR